MLLPATIDAGTGNRHYDFFTGVDTQVASPLGALELLSDVGNGRIVFSRVDIDGRMPVLVYDTVLNSTVETMVPVRFSDLSTHYAYFMFK